MDMLLDLSEYYQNEIQNLEHEISQLKHSHAKYTVNPRLNPFEKYTDEEFRRRFRLSKESVRFLYSLIGQQLEPIKTRPGFTISGMDKILITLRYFATASYHQVMADFYGVSDASVCKIVR